MGATPNILKSSLVDAQPRSGLAHAKILYLARKRFFARFLWGVESRIYSAQVWSLGLINLARGRLFQGSGHQPPCWQELGEFCEAAGSQIEVSVAPIRSDEVSKDRLRGAACLAPRSAVTSPGITLLTAIPPSLQPTVAGASSTERLQRDAPPTSPVHSIPKLKLRAKRFPDLCPVCGTPADEVCYLCSDKFCHVHMYSCLDCNTVLCGCCMDSHQAEGHWTDSDTTRELFNAIIGGAR